MSTCLASLIVGVGLRPVNGRDVTGWQTDPSVTEGPSFFTSCAGTKVNLTVLREGQTMELTVALKELVPVEADELGKGMS